MTNRKFIFWGTGNVARKFVYQHERFMEAVEIVGFTDNDKEKWDSLWEGYRVLSPEAILQWDYDYILILSTYFEEIRDGILEKYTVAPGKILSVDEAYQMYVRNVHGTEGGRKFASRSLISEISFSERICDRMLADMDYMFSYLYIQDKYKKFMEDFKSKLSVDNNKFEQISKEHMPIWVCWLQGMENAPEIVKCCVNSIVANVVGEIHIITYDNYADYVELDEYIIEKHGRGIISRTHFSDIIRLALLCKYGGIWMDATILMMDKGLPDYIYELPVFMYRVKENLDMGYPNPKLFTSWFLKSDKGNLVFKMVYKMHEEWWKTENEVPYFFIHYAMRLAWNMNKTCQEGWVDRLQIYDNCQVLRGMLNERYDEMLWNMMREEQPLQKLSWKSEYNKKDTFYGYIVDRYG